MKIKANKVCVCVCVSDIVLQIGVEFSILVLQMKKFCREAGQITVS